MKKALIIGGSGGLSSVVAKMAMNEYDVWAVTRGIRKLPEGVHTILADRNNYDEFAKAILSAGMNFDVVFDCICMNAKHAKDDIDILSKVTNRLVVISTDSVYHPLYKKTPQSEDGVFIEEEGDMASVSYGCNKRRMELVFLSDMESKTPRLMTTIFRPGHIYGPGFALGCFPENNRQMELPELILRGETMRLVGMGTYIIQPIFVDDLAKTMIDCVDNEKTYNNIYCIGGPDAVENKRYYEIIGEALGTSVDIDEIPVKGYLDRHPEFSGHLCHRIYDLSKLRETDVSLPSTKLEDGIRIHLRSQGFEVVAK